MLTLFTTPQRPTNYEIIHLFCQDLIGNNQACSQNQVEAVKFVEQMFGINTTAFKEHLHWNGYVLPLLNYLNIFIDHTAITRKETNFILNDALGNLQAASQLNHEAIDALIASNRQQCYITAAQSLTIDPEIMNALIITAIHNNAEATKQTNHYLPYSLSTTDAASIKSKITLGSLCCCSAALLSLLEKYPNDLPNFKTEMNSKMNLVRTIARQENRSPKQIAEAIFSASELLISLKRNPQSFMGNQPTREAEATNTLMRYVPAIFGVQHNENIYSINQFAGQLVNKFLGSCLATDHLPPQPTPPSSVTRDRPY